MRKLTHFSLVLFLQHRKFWTDDRNMCPKTKWFTRSTFSRFIQIAISFIARLVIVVNHKNLAHLASHLYISRCSVNRAILSLIFLIFFFLHWHDGTLTVTRSHGFVGFVMVFFVLQPNWKFSTRIVNMATFTSVCFFNVTMVVEVRRDFDFCGNVPYSFWVNVLWIELYNWMIELTDSKDKNGWQGCK